MKYKKTILIFCILLALFFLVGGYFIERHFNRKVKASPVMYPYQTYYGPANPILIVTQSKYKSDLIEYYSQIEKGERISFNFPLRVLPMSEKVYVLKYSSDSLLAKVVSYYDYGPYRGGNFTMGWVYAKCLHENPPPKKNIN